MVLDPPGNRAFVHQKIQKMRCGSAAGASAGSGAGKYDLKAIGGKRPALLDQPGGGTFSESARGLFFPVRTYYGIFAAASALFFTWRRAGVWAFVLGTLMGISRLYFYVHFPTDVLAGVILGFFCGFAGVFLMKKVQQTKFGKYL